MEVTPRKECIPTSYKNLAIFTFALFTSGTLDVTFSPLSTLVLSTYQTSYYAVNYVIQAFCMIFLPMCFPSIYVLDNKGLRYSMVLGAILGFVGTVIRCFINYSFFFVILGQTVAASGATFLYSAPSKMSAE